MNSTEARAAQWDRLYQHYVKEIAECNDALAEWGTKFNDNPLYAFEWSLGAMSCAASINVAEEILGAIEGGVATRETILKHAERQAMQGAAHPPQSTSPTSNLIAQYKTAAWAEAVDVFSGQSLHGGLDPSDDDRRVQREDRLIELEVESAKLRSELAQAIDNLG